jgi:hypothetical protein
MKQMNNQEFEKNNNWSDTFLPEIKQILGYYLIGKPPIVEDMEHNTDLIVLNMKPVRIACRIRRYEYYSKYSNEITIRSKTSSGCPTELRKIITGWGDYFFYGFSDESETKLYSWHLISLNHFRFWLFSYIANNYGKLPGIEKANKDGSTFLRAFNLMGMPHNIILAKKENFKELAQIR